MPTSNSAIETMKKEISDQMAKALKQVNDAKDAAGVDAGITAATGAENLALNLAMGALKKSIAPNHTSEDEDLQVELADFAASIQSAGENVLEVAKKKKIANGWPLP